MTDGCICRPSSNAIATPNVPRGPWSPLDLPMREHNGATEMKVARVVDVIVDHEGAIDYDALPA
eukprot:7360069-Pyramimonas_sp.AAC.1